MPIPRTRLLVRLLTLLILMGGCSSSDDRAVELARESAARQAAQSQQMAQQSEKLIEATGNLVKADAQARGELVEAQRALQEGLQVERQSLDRQHAELEAERRSLAEARIREPLIAQAVTGAALLLACVLPLVLCIYIVRNLGADEPQAALAEYLIQEIAAPSTSALLTTEQRPLEALPAAY